MTLEALTVWHGILATVFIVTFAAIADILWDATPGRVKRLRIIMVVTAIAAVLHVATGSYLYQFYRERIPTSPRSLILASDKPWLHRILMEYKEFVGGFVPILIIAATYAVFYYTAEELAAKRGIRLGILGVVTVAFVFTLIAFAFGALITKYAPLGGGLG
jgi:Na+/H+-dicarboxylate symporter